MRLAFSLVAASSACTTFAAGKKATADGSVIISHSDDGNSLADPRLVHVPAADHAAGSQRAITEGGLSYPRIVSHDLGPGYEPTSDAPTLNRVLGHIPQVAHTFAYWDGNYGIVNEHGLGFAETTCSAMFKTCGKGNTVGCEDGRKVGEALLSVDALSKIALERTTTARDAIALMGELAEKYGYYGSLDPNGSGEAMQVGDKDEAWTFNILADPTGTSAIWAAHRVPDEEVTVMSNMFTLREVEPNSTDWLYSPNIFSIAQGLGWWKPGTPLDFTRVYSNGEYGRKYYAGRRMWGGFRMIKPSLQLNEDYGNLRYDRCYPWSVVPDKLVTPDDFMTWHRDWYAGTPYDMTLGPAAGPFGTPDRYAVDGDGAWERSIAIYRANLVHVAQFRQPEKAPADMAAVVWFAAGPPHYAPFLPVPAKLTEQLPPLANAVPHRPDSASMSWSSRKVADVCQIHFNVMHDVVLAKQHELERAGAALVARGAPMSEFQDLVAHGLATWAALPDTLLLTVMENTVLSNMTALGYPQWWLDVAGFAKGPPPVPDQDQCPPQCGPSAPIVV